MKNSKVLKGLTVPVLDKGYVRLIDWLGDDQRIVETARISYKSPSKGSETDKKLLFYLWKHQHTSPFEACNLSFNIKMPIFVMRQFVRHRTFKINEQSARYSEMEPEFYIPSSWREQDTKNKQSSIHKGDWNPEIGCWGPTATGTLESFCSYSYDIYKSLLKAGIAKEMARMILPINLYTEIYVNCDLHNLMNFLKLRMDSHAQWEIQQYAHIMYKIMERLYPLTAEAFKKYKFEIKETNENN